MALLRSPFIRRRLFFFVPQLLLVTFIAFGLLQLLPGDPAQARAGPLSPPAKVEELRQERGYNDPFVTQYIRYVGNLVQGDFGDSWFTGQPVSKDLKERLPATIELITISLVVALGIMIPLGVRVAAPKQRGPMAVVDKYLVRVVRFYGLLAGSLADFWLALILIFIFYATLGVSPEPTGAFAFGVRPPPVTYFPFLDSVIDLNLTALKSYVGHLVLPVAALVFVYGGPILKMVIASMAEIRSSQYVENAQAMGLKSGTVRFIQLRNSLPPILTIIGVIYGFLLGGAVLVERIFGLNGFGNYGVNAVLVTDWDAAQSFMLVAAVWVMITYLVVDIAHAAVDPRVRL